MQRTSHPGVSLSPTWGQRGTQATVLSLGGGGEAGHHRSPLRDSSDPGKCLSPRGTAGCTGHSAEPGGEAGHHRSPPWDSSVRGSPRMGQLCLHWLETSCLASVQTCEENRHQWEKQACKRPRTRQGGSHVLSEPPGRPRTQAPAKPRSRACGGLQVLSPQEGRRWLWQWSAGCSTSERRGQVNPPESSRSHWSRVKSKH